MIKVLFICHGNICRSPMGEFILKDMVKKRGLEDSFQISSCATSREEIGNPMHPGARAKLDAMEIPHTKRQARQLTKQDYEVYDFLLKNWYKLKFSPPIKADRIEEYKINPKRMQREISSQLENKGIGTKAQQALKLQHEQAKIERKTQSREQKDAEKERQFALRQEKKKAKHRGR